MIAQTPTALSLPLRTPKPTSRARVIAPAEIRPRFTTDGSAELEQHVARTCEKIAAGVRGIVSARRLEGLLLGSTSTRAAETSPAPVVVVRDRQARRETTRQVRLLAGGTKVPAQRAVGAGQDVTFTSARGSATAVD